MSVSQKPGAITANGNPVARVVPLAPTQDSRFGFLPESLKQETRIPEDFDTIGASGIADLFTGHNDQ